MLSAAQPKRAWTVLIPAHNEAKTVREIVEGALIHVKSVIVIDDGSTDGTAEALEGLPIELVRQERNRGKGPCLAEGLDRAVAAGADGILTLDADGQHDPDDIPAFLAAAEASPHCLILGDRFDDRASMPPGRAASIRFGDFFISWATATPVRDAQCGMRLYPAEFWRRLYVPVRERRHFVFETAVLLHAAKVRVGLVRVPISARYSGHTIRSSHFQPMLDTLRIACAITRFLFFSGGQLRGFLIATGILR